MKNVKDAKFIESLISQNDLKAFVCSNRDDLTLFLDEVWAIHIVCMYKKSSNTIFFHNLTPSFFRNFSTLTASLSPPYFF